MLPIVSQACLDSVIQSLLEGGDKDFTSEVFAMIENDNPVLAKMLLAAINDALRESDPELMARKFVNTICAMYKLLHSQDEANGMEV